MPRKNRPSFSGSRAFLLISSLLIAACPSKKIEPPKNRPSIRSSVKNRPSTSLLPLNDSKTDSHTYLKPRSLIYQSQYYLDIGTAYMISIYPQEPNSLVMSNPGYFTQEGLLGKEADSNNNHQPDHHEAAKRARMDDSQAQADSSSSDGSPSDNFSSSSSDTDMQVDQKLVSYSCTNSCIMHLACLFCLLQEDLTVTIIEWYTPWHVNPWNWRPAISPLAGTIPHPADPRGQPQLPLHQRRDPRHKQLRKEPIVIPFFRLDNSDKRIQDPRLHALIPQASPSMERMHRGQQLHHRLTCRTTPFSGPDLLTGIMNSMEKLHCSTSPIYSKTARTPLALRITIDPIPPPIPESPHSPVRPKGSRNIPKGGKLILTASNDPLSKRPRPPSKFSAPTPGRLTFKPSLVSQPDNMAQRMDALIASQIVKIGKQRTRRSGKVRKNKAEKAKVSKSCYTAQALYRRHRYAA